jgi:hypothetical protein
MDWAIGIRFPAGVEDFSLLQSIQTSSGAWSTSYPKDIRGSFSRVKWQRHKTDHSPPSSAKVKNDGAVPPLPHTSPWCGVFLIKHKDNLHTFQKFLFYAIT